ncbi:hypothetical protein JHL22_03455 [Advenella sp. WQ 585]|uniref:Lipoprotein n=1 Tax=Advenella mandrilli TaxID=2800330 RepID=A0ABS1EEL4_9BURK|nr:hypothetical protein [Advenella mandrilli]MBK1780267.1 hypothetical protein [Advenella mandrilli]
MKKIFTAIAILFASGQVLAQVNVGAGAEASAGASSGASSSANVSSGGAAIIDLSFGGSEQRKSQRIHTTPNVYAPASMFGGANNCGQSNTIGVGFTGFGIGGSMAGESDACNAREDTSIAYKLGYKEVADMRFFCFGEDVNRMAYEATGRRCPSSSTAKGLPDNAVASNPAPVSSTVAVNNPGSNAVAVNSVPVNSPRQTRAIASSDELDAQRLRTFYGNN